jgi:hypothetical protein
LVAPVGVATEVSVPTVAGPPLFSAGFSALVLLSPDVDEVEDALADFLAPPGGPPVRFVICGGFNGGERWQQGLIVVAEWVIFFGAAACG